MPIVTYSILRLGLFAACLGALFWAGLGGWLLVVVAAVAAWGVSYVVLAGPRDAAAVALAGRAAKRASGHRFSAAAEADAAHEDAVVDAATDTDANVDANADAATRDRDQPLHSEPEPEQHPVAELEHPGSREDRDEGDPARAGEHGHAQHADRKREHQHEQ